MLLTTPGVAGAAKGVSPRVAVAVAIAIAIAIAGRYMGNAAEGQPVAGRNW